MWAGRLILVLVDQPSEASSQRLRSASGNTSPLFGKRLKSPPAFPQNQALIRADMRCPRLSKPALSGPFSPNRPTPPSPTPRKPAQSPFTGTGARRSAIEIAPTPEPSLSAVAGNPFPSFGFGFKAGDVLRVAARPSGHNVPFVPCLHRLRIDRDPVVRFGHAQQYAPGPSRKPSSQGPALFEMTHHPAIATSVALLSGLSRAIRHLKEQF